MSTKMSSYDLEAIRSAIVAEREGWVDVLAHTTSDADRGPSIRLDGLMRATNAAIHAPAPPSIPPDFAALREAVAAYDAEAPSPATAATLLLASNVVFAARALLAPKAGEERTPPKAGDWAENLRHYPDDGDPEGASIAAGVDHTGWWVLGSDHQDFDEPIASGDEPGVLGMCLADLCLVAHGLLAWERIAFPSDRHHNAAARELSMHATPHRPWSEALTPATLPAVLAAVRGAK